MEIKLARKLNINQNMFCGIAKEKSNESAGKPNKHKGKENIKKP